MIILTSASFGTVAEVKTKAIGKNLIDLAKADTEVSARDTSNLRCWQYGELLFEETHLSEKKLSSAENMLVFESDTRPGYQNGNDRKLFLINAGSATCLYEKI